MITLRDGRERTLRYPLSKVKAAKKEFGASLLTGTGLHDMDEDRLPKLIWYGLSADDQELTPDTVADLIETPDLEYVMAKFIEAFTGQKPTKAAPKNEQGQSDGSEISTGLSFGPSAATTSA
jgi:hypothetical protein